MRALGLGIEGADRFQRVAEEIEPHRLVHARRIKVEDAAAHRVFAGLAHRRGAVVAVEFQPARSTPSMPSTLPGAADSACVAISSRAGTRCSAALTVVSTTAGCSRPLQAREPRQRRHALRDDAGMRRHAVVGQAVPGREFAAPRSRARRTPARAPAPPCAGRRGRSPARWSRARSARAATARARSATTSPSAPSATPASVSGRPGAEQFGRRFRHLPSASRVEVEIAHATKQRRVVLGGTALAPVIQASRSGSGTSSSCSNASSSASSSLRYGHRQSGP